MSVPSNEAVLRRLFWKLFFRGRGLSRKRGNEGKVQKHGMWGQLGLYTVCGFFLCPLAFRLNTLTFSLTLHAATLFMTVFQMVMTAGTVLFNKEEAEILLHRPVLPRELLRAKVTVLCAVSGMLAAALNLPGMIASTHLRDAHWWFPLAHLCSLTLLIVFSAGAIVVMYQACLRWFGRERLDGMMTTMQTVLTVGLVLASQSYRMVSQLKLDHPEQVWWMLAMPPMWFASLDVVLSATGWQTWLLYPALAGVAATLVLGWLGFHRLAAIYGQGLMTMNESAGGAKKLRKHRIRHLVKIPPFSWWLRNPVEQSSFLLATAYFFRDRETKLRLYPAMAQMMAMPFVVMFGGRSSSGGMEVAFAGIYMGWLPIIAMQTLQYSEQWPASEVFDFTPNGQWQSLFHGARKAALSLLIVPALVILCAVVAFFKHIDAKYLLLLPNIIAIPVWSLVPGITGRWLPLSKPFDAKTQQRRGCGMMLLVMSISGALSFLAWYSMKLGWLQWFLLGEVVLAAIIFSGMKAAMRGRSAVDDDE